MKSSYIVNQCQHENLALKKGNFLWDFAVIESLWKLPIRVSIVESVQTLLMLLVLLDDMATLYQNKGLE